MRIHKTRRVTRSVGANIAVTLLVALAGLFTAIPLLYALLNSFKPLGELFLFPPRFFVQNPTLRNYAELLHLGQDMLVPFERYLFNSLFVSVATTVAYIFLASMAAFALAKFRFPGSTVVTQAVVFAILFRPEVTAIPQYNVLAALHMIDTYWALICPALAGSFGVFLMRQFMSSLPDELLEAAYIDGARELRTFWRVVMPMVRPAWLTLAVFTFQGIWNTTGIQYIFSENLKMLPTALSQISTAGIARAGVASAVAVFLMLPPILLFLVSETNILETMSHSGLKG